MLSACSAVGHPSPAVVLASTFTPSPTWISPTNTIASHIEAPNPVSTLEGQVAADWNGIPIMPNAAAGEGDEESYVFTIKATPEQVQTYYQVELAKLGWQPLAADGGDSSLIFTNGTSTTLTISILAKGDEVLVLLAE